MYGFVHVMSISFSYRKNTNALCGRDFSCIFIPAWPGAATTSRPLRCCYPFRGPRNGPCGHSQERCSPSVSGQGGPRPPTNNKDRAPLDGYLRSLTFCDMISLPMLTRPMWAKAQEPTARWATFLPDARSIHHALQIVKRYRDIHSAAKPVLGRHGPPHAVLAHGHRPANVRIRWKSAATVDTGAMLDMFRL